MKEDTKKYKKPVLVPIEPKSINVNECHSGGSADSCYRGYHD